MITNYFFRWAHPRIFKIDFPISSSQNTMLFHWFIKSFSHECQKWCLLWVFLLWWSSWIETIIFWSFISPIILLQTNHKFIFSWSPSLWWSFRHQSINLIIQHIILQRLISFFKINKNILHIFKWIHLLRSHTWLNWCKYIKYYRMFLRPLSQQAK